MEEKKAVTSCFFGREMKLCFISGQKRVLPSTTLTHDGTCERRAASRILSSRNSCGPNVNFFYSKLYRWKKEHLFLASCFFVKNIDQNARNHAKMNTNPKQVLSTSIKTFKITEHKLYLQCLQCILIMKFKCHILFQVESGWRCKKLLREITTSMTKHFSDYASTKVCCNSKYNIFSMMCSRIKRYQVLCSFFLSIFYPRP